MTECLGCDDYVVAINCCCGCDGCCCFSFEVTIVLMINAVVTIDVVVTIVVVVTSAVVDLW